MRIQKKYSNPKEQAAFEAGVRAGMSDKKVMEEALEELNSKGKCSCGKDGTKDECPYSSEVNGVIKECDCCKDCRHNCFMDI